MDITLPNGERLSLDNDLPLEDKVELILKITRENMDDILYGWERDKVKYFLDSLSSYLVWHKENREKGKRGHEDKEVMSRKKLEKMNRFKKTSREITFTDLSKKNSEKLLGDRGAELWLKI